MAKLKDKQKNNPEYQRIASEIGISKFNSANDLQQVKAEIARRQEQQNAPAPAPPAPPPPPPQPESKPEPAPPRPAPTPAPAPPPQDYARAFQEAIASYQSTVASIQTQQATLQSDLAKAQQERDSAKAAAEEAKAKADEYERQKKVEQEIAVNEQLGSIRSGSTVSGSAGPGLGSLSAGRSSYSVSTGGKQGGVLDRAYKDIDPTDSVLDKDVAIEAAGASSGVSGGGSRTEARRRALAAGGNASSYYSRRFG